MGICVVAVIFSSFIVLAFIVCLYRPARKDIDLSRPLILTEEVGKKKKRKNKKGDADKAATDEAELVSQSTADKSENGAPPRAAIEHASLPPSPDRSHAKSEDRVSDESHVTDDEVEASEESSSD